MEITFHSSDFTLGIARFYMHLQKRMHTSSNCLISIIQIITTFIIKDINGINLKRLKAVQHGKIADICAVWLRALVFQGW